MATTDQRAEFRALFLSASTQHLFATAMEGHLPATGLRGVAWRFFLGTLPTNTPLEGWVERTLRRRAEYAALVEVHCVDPHKKGAELDPTICNPLSQHEESPWNAYYEAEELRTEIRKDLTRLHPGYTREGEDDPFFASPAIVDTMERVLVVWSKRAPALSYRQGMHELLAALVLALHNDAEQAASWLPAATPAEAAAAIEAASKAAAAVGESASGGGGGGGGDEPRSASPSASALPQEAQNLSDEQMVPLMRALLDPSGVEADAFWLFDQLMVYVKDWFEPGTGAGGGGGGGGGGRGGSLPRVSLDEQRRARQAAEKRSPLLLKCAHIQDTLLRRADPQLHGVLAEKEVQPQLYLLRWLRLLFGREFHLADSMVVWDALFAYGQGLMLVEYMAVSMLLYVRASLIEGDYTQTLRRLLKYPPVEHVHTLVERALHLKRAFAPGPDVSTTRAPGARGAASASASAGAAAVAPGSARMAREPPGGHRAAVATPGAYGCGPSGMSNGTGGGGHAPFFTPPSCGTRLEQTHTHTHAAAVAAATAAAAAAASSDAYARRAAEESATLARRMESPLGALTEVLKQLAAAAGESAAAPADEEAAAEGAAAAAAAGGAATAIDAVAVRHALAELRAVQRVLTARGAP